MDTFQAVVLLNTALQGMVINCSVHTFVHVLCWTGLVCELFHCSFATSASAVAIGARQHMDVYCIHVIVHMSTLFLSLCTMALYTASNFPACIDYCCYSYLYYCPTCNINIHHSHCSRKAIATVYTDYP